MSTSLIRRAIVPVLALVLVTAAACTSQSAGLTGPTDHVAITAAKNVKPATTVLADDDAKTGRLIGPHFSLAVAGYTTTTKVSDKQAKLYGFDSGPIKAAKGTQFFLAIMDASTDVKSGATAVLSVDGKDRKLKRLPSAGEAIAAVVPTKADVVLKATDEGRTQTINLRDGKRDSQIAGFYAGQPDSNDPQDYDASGKATGKAKSSGGTEFEPETRTLHVSMTVGKATKSPWNADEKWAEEGDVWVSVPISDMTTDSVWGFKEHTNEPIMTWKLKASKTFSLKPSGGHKAKTEADTTFTADKKQQPINESQDVKFNPDNATLLFQVPDNTTKTTLKITPGGSLKAIWSDRTGTCSWDKAPKTGEIDISF
ncbi:MAG TPA: hypothetical protein VE172_20840 [Stackebrandtia sp.]|uniref:hypothetical protein n=1 Tax=Stackebrandtia sp. TaxID=2023065 RepID=UPI002D563156|nr:hypothetical protein [Stackebrandtia sp.]HZE41255.1 hypothetical protein [Stackebrandtia sp.]